MAKSDAPLSRLVLDRAYSPPHRPTWADDKPINGFDTETADGDIFALSVAWAGEDPQVYASKSLMGSDRVLKYLTFYKARGAINVWYNLDFDANVVLKGLLSDRDLAVLSVTGHVEAGDIEVTYIPSKFLRIKDANKHTYTHFDASQFVYGSLGKAAQEWLGQEKLVELVDTKKFGKGDHGVNGYIRDHWDDIKTYAKRDAKLVRDLWAEISEQGENLGIPMGLPFSTGYLAESYLNATLSDKPGLGPRSMAKVAWEAYAGGRFELAKRGDVGPVVGPDINSAYPWVLSSLPDPKTLRWRRLTAPTIEAVREADYGFVRATVTTDSNRSLQPFALKDPTKDILIYPALEDREITSLKEIFIHALDNGYLLDYEIKEVWLGYVTKGTDFPFDFIGPMYEERQEAKDNGRFKKAELLKIILNSMYGKTAQTTPKRKAMKESTELKENQYFVPGKSLPESLKPEYENGIIEWLEVGAWFNPFLAAYITGMTRLELHKRVLQYGLEDNTVMLATDSIMVEQGAFDGSDFEGDLCGKGLGRWAIEYRGDAFVIGAGIYQVLTPQGLKVKTRGFKEAQIPHGWEAEAMKANGKIEIESLRPRTIREQVWTNGLISEVGKFDNPSRELNPDMDRKRKWAESATFEILLREKQGSEPLLLGAP